MAKPVKKGRAAPKARSKPARKSKPAKATARVLASAHAERFDREPYDVPVMDLAEAIALATSLLAVKPGKPTPAVVEESKRVAAARERAREVQKGQRGAAPSLDARAYDAAMDRAWATFVRRIQDHVDLPADRHGHAPDAARIFAIVRDLSILQLNYLAEFAQIGARLDSLKREGLLEASRALAGTEFVDEVLTCHGDYGRALGVFGGPAAGAGASGAGGPGDRAADRGEARNALVDAISEYAVQVSALARAGRPDSWATVKKALAPIAELRARLAQTRRTHEAPRVRPAHPPVVKVKDAAGHPT